MKVKKISANNIKKNVPTWSIKKGKLYKKFVFLNFSDALGFIVQVGIEYSGLKWVDERPKPTEAELNAKIDELQADYDAQEYSRTRALLYPDIGDQLDDLYKKGAFSDEMAAKIKKVKDDNPKPS